MKSDLTELLLRLGVPAELLAVKMQAAQGHASQTGGVDWAELTSSTLLHETHELLRTMLAGDRACFQYEH